MKHNLFTLFFLSLGLFSSSIQAQNLISNGEMDTKGIWFDTYLNTSENDYPNVVWGNTADKPQSGEGGNLYFVKENSESTSQYCIYQPVELTQNETYSFDASFKSLKMDNSWLQVFIDKEAPINGDDYSGNVITQFNVWWAGTLKNDGKFSEDVINYNSFTPEETGTYYLVIKCGANGGGSYEMILDNISLVVEERPSTSFTTDLIEGMAPLTVSFKSDNVKVTEWLWEFGDDKTSTEENPTHTYDAEGTYTVQLTAKNNVGEVIVKKENLIVVHKAVSLETGGVVVGGDMTDATKWTQCDLNTPTGKLPTAIWNDKDHTPKAGKDGCLYFEGEANESETVQYCIFQTVKLEKDRVYYFDAAIKDFTGSKLDHCFAEVFLSDGEPVNGSDFGNENGTMIAKFSTWDERNVLPGLDGTFGLSGTVIPYISTNEEEKVLVIKIGTSDWENKSFPFKIAIDEISLIGEKPKPYTNFISENNQGFAPLEVTFENTTLFGNTFVWDFGDGATETSDAIFVNHIYENVGEYTVSLTAVNEIGDSTIIKKSYVIIADRPELPAGEKLYGGNMENRALWQIATLGASVVAKSTWNYTDATPSKGEGGCLRLEATVKNTGSNIVLFQQVKLNKDSVYVFDCEFRDLADADHFWAQAYILDTRPNDTNDNLDEDNCLGQLNTWKEDNNPNKYDGSFKALALKGNKHKGDVCEYQPESTGTYYFALKIGNTDWENKEFSFDVVIDNLSLKGEPYGEKPYVDFIVTTAEEGDIPFTVEFMNISENATSYLWDFGDGNTSTEEHPVHIYTTPGVYSVTLTAYKGSQSYTKKYSELITVTDKGGNGINNINDNDCNIVISNSRIIVSNVERSIIIYNSTGNIIESVALNNDEFVSEELEKGIYIVVVDNKGVKVVLD